jgi:hypothetical protein
MKRWARGCTLTYKDFAGVLLSWWAMPFQVSAGERNEK